MNRKKDTDTHENDTPEDHLIESVINAAFDWQAQVKAAEGVEE